MRKFTIYSLVIILLMVSVVKLNMCFNNRVFANVSIVPQIDISEEEI